jgi:hypothetical protein
MIAKIFSASAVKTSSRSWNPPLPGWAHRAPGAGNGRPDHGKAAGHEALLTFIV